MLGSALVWRKVDDMDHPSLRLIACGALVRHTNLGADRRIRLDELHRQHLTHEPPEDLAVDPVTVSVVARPYWKRDCCESSAMCHGCVVGEMVKWRLCVARIMGGATLKEWLAQTRLHHRRVGRLP